LLYDGPTKPIYTGGIIKRWVGFAVGMLMPGFVIIIVREDLLSSGPHDAFDD